MAEFEIDPLQEGVQLNFLCPHPHCGQRNETEFLYIPEPDYSAETHHDSESSADYDEHCCPKCGKQFEIRIHNGYYGGWGTISLADGNEEIEDIKVKKYFPDNNYEDDYNGEYFHTAINDTIGVLDKIDVLDNSSKQLLHRSLYANLISGMEAYLSNTLLDKTLKDNEALEKAKKHFQTSDKREVKKKIINTTFSNIERAKLLYKEILDIDLKQMDILKNYISIRHDIVHRNGKDKQGKLHNITKEDINDLAKNISLFISSNIDLHFLLKNYNLENVLIKEISCEDPFNTLQ